MTYNAFILLPGTRWPEPEARRLWNAMDDRERAMLCDFGMAAEPPVHQRIAPAPFSRAPHLVWAWRVFAQRPGAPVTAPYAWIAQGGPQQHAELWAVTIMKRDTQRVLGPATIAKKDILSLLIKLSPVFEKAGWRLQCSGQAFYAVCHTSLDASAAPAASLSGLALNELEAMTTGSETQILRQLRLELDRYAEQDCFFWIDGGGSALGALTPTKIRAIASDDPVLRGWAEQAGLLRHRATTLSKGWAEAPKGDLVALVHHLWDPWLRRDLNGWRQALPLAHAAFHKLREAARSDLRDADTAAVMFGEGSSSTLMPKNRSIMSFLSRTKYIDPLQWIIDGEP